MRPEFRTESIITASGPIRYLIRCRRAKFEDRGHSDTQLIERLSKRQGLDPGKVFHLGTDKTANLVHIVFDYGNLDHHHRCTIRAFKGVSLKEVQFPGAMTDYLHRYVDDWIDEVETNKNRFPVQTEVYIGPVLDCSSLTSSRLYRQVIQITPAIQIIHATGLRAFSCRAFQAIRRPALP
jgi:hypothetical protein